MVKFKGKGLKSRILKPWVIVEGIREHNYLKRILSDKISIIGGRNSDDSYSTTKLKKVDNAIMDALDAGVKCYWLVDLDRLYIDKDARTAERQKYQQLKNRYNNNAKVTFCDSMPSFELWLLLHFNKYGLKQYSQIGDDGKELLRFIPGYLKTNVTDYSEFYNKENLDMAISRAEEIDYDIDQQSHTSVWKLMKDFIDR